MNWDVHKEFEIVDYLLASKSKSKGVDAFPLSLLKAERQARRIFTFLAYQSPAFGPEHKPQLRTSLERKRHFYFTSSLAGINRIAPRTLDEFCSHGYQILLLEMSAIRKRRGKIFHGQLTDENLSTDDLAAMAEKLKCWCVSLADAASAELGYDGFSCRSFFKHPNPDFYRSLKTELKSVDDYVNLVTKAIQDGNNRLYAAPLTPLS